MRKSFLTVCGLFLLAACAAGQGKRLWVLRAPGEVVEYDPATFAAKQTVKVPADVVQSPGNLSVNRVWQILFAAAVALPRSKEEAEASHPVWFWNGHAAAKLDLGVKREV